MRLLWAIEHALTRISRRMERTQGITGPQRLAIRIVGRFPGISAGALAEVLHLHPSTLTGVLQRLTSRGLMERAEDPLDRRRSLLKLTARGRRVDTSDRGSAEAAVGAVLERLRATDVAATKRVLLELAAALGPAQGARNGRGRRPRSVS